MARFKLPLVLVGRILPGGEMFQDWPYRFTELSPSQLKGLYSAAAGFIYPSLYEGFGLPVLETMACGLPVVASNRSCLPEICGDAAVLVDPRRDDLAEGIDRIFEEPERYRRRGFARVKGFSWQQTARETIQVYQEVVNPDNA